MNDLYLFSASDTKHITETYRQFKSMDLDNMDPNQLKTIVEEFTADKEKWLSLLKASWAFFHIPDDHTLFIYPGIISDQDAGEWTLKFFHVNDDAKNSGAVMPFKEIQRIYTDYINAAPFVLTVNEGSALYDAMAELSAGRNKDDAIGEIQTIMLQPVPLVDAKTLNQAVFIVRTINNLITRFMDQKDLAKELQFPLHHLKENADKRTYRTRKKAQAAGAITETPESLAIITSKKFQNSLSLHQDGSAYLLPPYDLEPGAVLEFDEGVMRIKGTHIKEISEVELQNMKTKEGIKDIDLPYLTVFYNLILDQFQKNKFEHIDDILTFSVPALARYIGLPSNLSQDNIERLIEKVQSYHNIVGVLHDKRNGRSRSSLYPVLNFEGYSDKTNTISFSSPYMNYVIQTVYEISIRRRKDGKPQLSKNGAPLMLPSHTYLIDPSIVTERNKAAVINVYIIIALIEQAGNNKPHIKARTLIERNEQLADRLNRVKNPWELLKSTFIKTWELLRTKTRLSEEYKNINLPDPNDMTKIPSMGNIDSMIFEFAHDGKIKHSNCNEPLKNCNEPLGKLQ